MTLCEESCSRSSVTMAMEWCLQDDAPEGEATAGGGRATEKGTGGETAAL